MSVYGKKALHHWRFTQEDLQRYEHSSPEIQLLLLKKWYPVNAVFVFSHSDENKYRVVDYKMENKFWLLILSKLGTSEKLLAHPLKMIPYVDLSVLNTLKSKKEIWSKYIKVDLRRCNSAVEFNELIKENGISPDKLSGKDLFELKKALDIVFLDPKEFEIHFFVYRGEDYIRMYDDHLTFLLQMPPLFTQKMATFKKMSLDAILDKINRTGIESLNARERKYLDDLSHNDFF